MASPIIPSWVQSAPMEPVILRRLNGGFLAVSPDDAEISFGVEGTSESEARKLFALELDAWRRTRTDENRHETGHMSY